MIRHELDNPFLEALGATLTEWQDGVAEIAMPISATHLNRQRVLQGGAVATLLDAACGYAGLYSDSGETVHGFTLSLTINYLDRGIGQQVTAKGMLERKGKSIYFCRGEAWVDGRILIATAQGTFKYTR
ncbi:PaaI family thioesterase [Burkholderia sp. Ac-20345]|uniref:PaaI family thioesterase n=1 Tax=Burkholderia sp. Ac-20345 TaxID=2703891 RepID=UPI00197C8AEC|nr:PaaI family thioesterase [Burkholderia sp. Ac-20345]MBN3782228.1 PaaI family thioesterase [Burkholderia sp. Ac-20345]